MWKQINGSSFYLLFTQENYLEICVTDYLTVWSTFFSEPAFLCCLKESNDLLTLANENEYIQKGVQILSNPEQLRKHKIEKDSDGKTLFLSMTVMCGYPFTFQYRLSKGTDEVYFQKVTRTLLTTIKDLRSSQSELRNLLKKKDKEIDEYKEEGGEIVLRHLKTVAFNDEEHMRRHKLYEETFGDADVPTCLLEHEPVPVKNVVKQEPIVAEAPIAAISIKPEPSTQDMEATTTIKPVPVSCKQEVIKTEPKSSINSPRKRMKKLNY